MKNVIFILLIMVSLPLMSLPFDKIRLYEEYQVCTTLDGPEFFSAKDEVVGYLEISFLKGNQYAYKWNFNMPLPDYMDNENPFNEIKGNYTTTYNKKLADRELEEIGYYDFEISFDNIGESYKIKISKDGPIHYTSSAPYPTDRSGYNVDELIIIMVGRIEPQ